MKTKLQIVACNNQLYRNVKNEDGKSQWDKWLSMGFLGGGGSGESL